MNCRRCGTNIQDGEMFCPACGAKYQASNDIEANKLMAVLAYLGMLIIIPLIKGGYKESPFLKFHINQAIVFYIGYAISMLLGIIPSIGSLLAGILSLGIAVLQIISIIGVFKGKTKSFPIISKIKTIK